MKIIEFDFKNIGRVFGDFTVIKLHSTKDRIKVLCKCVCGAEKIKIWSELLRGYHLQDCGKCKIINPLNYIDTKIGKLQILEIFPKKDLGGIKRTTAKCLCECGKKCEIQFYPIYRGKISSCGCLLKQKYENQKLDKKVIAQNLILKQYKTNAASRNLSFKLTDEQVIKMCSQNCYYCGEEPSNNFYWKSHKRLNGSYIYNGIDRKNNNIGYTSENSVPCCQTCNFNKRNNSENQFLEWIDKVYKYQHKI